MSILIKNIKCLVNTRTENKLLRGKDLVELPCMKDAYIIIENDTIVEYGNMNTLNQSTKKIPTTEIDAHNQFVLPTWCDSHTHLVFEGSRENEFVDKINGLSYAEIASRGGGILHSAEKIQSCSEDELFITAWKKIDELAKLGTGAIEIKSGYGLTVEAELKMLRVIKKLKEKSPVTIKSTFLGAHTYPLAFKENHEGYIDQLINEMLPIIAHENLANYIDVFCENGFFSVSEMEKICTAGKKIGLIPKLHVNQLNSFGGLQSAIALQAKTVDHLETMTEKDIIDLASSDTIGTLLPTAAFFLRMPYQPARTLIDQGCAIAIASDYNPGSSPSGNMNFVISLSCIQMKMHPHEAINAATINGAYAMDVENDLGSIQVGKKANLIFLKPVNSINYIPYAFGSNLIDKVMIKGNFI